MNNLLRRAHLCFSCSSQLSSYFYSVNNSKFFLKQSISIFSSRNLASASSFSSSSIFYANVSSSTDFEIPNPEKIISKRPVSAAVSVHLKHAKNNIFGTAVDEAGRVIFKTSSGQCGFKGPKRPTTSAAEAVAKQISINLLSRGIKEVSVVFKSVCSSPMKSALQSLFSTQLVDKRTGKSLELKMVSLVDRVAVAHNGLRKRKPRRV